MTRGAILSIGALSFAAIAAFDYAFVLKPILDTAPSSHTPDSFTASVQHGVVVLTGRVADESSKLLLRRAAEETFGPANVVEDLRTWRSAPGGATIAKSAKVLQQMRSGTWMQPSYTANGQGASLAGLASQPEDRESVTRAVEVAILGTRVRNNIRVAPIGSRDWVSGKIQAALTARPIEFHSSSAVMRPDSLAALDDIAALLKAPLGVKIEVQAHVNTTPAMGGEESQLLSDRRAEAVRAYLIVRGVPTDRLIARGFGATKPVGMPGSEISKRLNDRIEFAVLPQ